MEKLHIKLTIIIFVSAILVNPVCIHLIFKYMYDVERKWHKQFIINTCSYPSPFQHIHPPILNIPVFQFYVSSQCVKSLLLCMLGHGEWLGHIRSHCGILTLKMCRTWYLPWSYFYVQISYYQPNDSYPWNLTLLWCLSLKACHL
jgi:hypothetical protein